MAASISKTTILELPHEYELQLVSQLWQIKYPVHSLPGSGSDKILGTPKRYIFSGSFLYIDS